MHIRTRHTEYIWPKSADHWLISILNKYIKYSLTIPIPVRCWNEHPPVGGCRRPGNSKFHGRILGQETQARNQSRTFTPERLRNFALPAFGAWLDERSNVARSEGMEYTSVLARAEPLRVADPRAAGVSTIRRRTRLLGSNIPALALQHSRIPILHHSTIP
jgi:hypothetical protein